MIQYGQEKGFAVPGESWIIDLISRKTGRGFYSGETLDEVRKRHPGAIEVVLSDWIKEKAERQNIPVEWTEATEGHFFEMLEVLPPIGLEGGAFLVGEATDHDAATNMPRYQAYKTVDGKRFASSRPMTVSEFRKTVTFPQGA